MAIKKSQLYSALWESCNALRGSMDASQYKDYVLVVLFIWGIAGKGNRNVGRGFDPETDNQKLDETKELIREQSRWSAYWSMKK